MYSGGRTYVLRRKRRFDKRTACVVGVAALLLMAGFFTLAYQLGKEGPAADPAAPDTATGGDEADATSQQTAVTPADPAPRPPAPPAPPQPQATPPSNPPSSSYLPPVPQVTLAATLSSVVVPGSVSFTLGIQHMDADTLSWSLDVWDDGSEDDFGTGNPAGATIHTVTLDDPAQAGPMRVKVTVQDENTATITRYVDVTVLAPCDLPQLAVKADPFDDAVAIAKDASEITCYGATRVADYLRLELSVLDRDDVVLEEGQKLRYYLYFTAQWDGSSTYNRITVDYTGTDVTATWDRLGPLFIYEPRTDNPQFTVAWEGDSLQATVPLNDVTVNGALPADGNRMMVYAEAWIQRPAGQSNTFLDFVASPAQGEDYHYIKFQGDDLILETEPVA